MSWWKKKKKLNDNRHSMSEENPTVEVYLFKEAYGWCRVTYENKKMTYRSLGQGYAKEVPSSLFSTKVRVRVLATNQTHEWNVFLSDSVLEEKLLFLMKNELEDLESSIILETWYEVDQWDELKEKSGCRIENTDDGVLVQQLATMEKVLIPNDTLSEFIPKALLLFYRYDQDANAWFQRLSFGAKKQGKSIS